MRSKHPEVIKSFMLYPKSVAKVKEILATGRSIGAVLGDGFAAVVEWYDDEQMSGEALKYVIKNKWPLPKDADGIPRLAYICWGENSTIDQVFEAGTVSVVLGGEYPITLEDGTELAVSSRIDDRGRIKVTKHG